MYFFYKVKKLINIHKNEEKIIIELYDFTIGKVERIRFDDEKFISVEQQLRQHLKDVMLSYELREI